MADSPPSFVVECLWPDVRESDLRALDRRVAEVTAELGRPGLVRYLGAILLREDEVVLCQFEGTAEAIREVAERAEIPFERILSADRSPQTAWSDVPHPEGRRPDEVESPAIHE